MAHELHVVPYQPMQATELLLSQVPAVTVEYCLSYLSPHLDNWRAVLSLLLEQCTSENGDEVCYSLYKGELIVKQCV